MKPDETFTVFYTTLFKIGRWKFSASFSTFGLAVIFDERYLEIILLLFLITYRKDWEQYEED